jgi:hypothetical protein
MAVKTFTSTVLTSSDTNTFLANAGLVFVKAHNVGATGVTSITVTDAFNSTYDAYKIVATNVTTTGNGIVSFALGGIATGWYGNLIYANFSSGAVSSFGYNNVASISHAGGTNSQGLMYSVEVLNPFLAKAKFMTSIFVDNANAGTIQTQNTSTTSATSFTLGCTAGTMTGGQITVYGYRKG